MGKQIYLSNQEARWILDLIQGHQAAQQPDEINLKSVVSDKVQSVLGSTRKKRNPQEYDGLSGFLTPDGTFHPCAYQEHRELAVKLVEQYQIDFTDGDSNHIPNFIKFGCLPWVDKSGNSGCHVFSQSKPTEKQETWLLQHLERMTEVQQRIVLGALEKTGIEGSQR